MIKKNSTCMKTWPRSSQRIAWWNNQKKTESVLAVPCHACLQWRPWSLCSSAAWPVPKIARWGRIGPLCTAVSAKPQVDSLGPLWSWSPPPCHNNLLRHWRMEEITWRPPCRSCQDHATITEPWWWPPPPAHAVQLVLWGNRASSMHNQQH